MVDLTKTVDWGGLDLVVNKIKQASKKGLAKSANTILQANSSGQVASKRVIYTLTTAQTLTAADSGALVVLNAAAGFTTTLPAPVAGLYFDFVIRTTVTSGTMKIITDAATTFLTGSLFSSITATPTLTVYTANGSTHLALNMDGTTKGGYIGTTLRFVCTSATLWEVSGFLPQTGSVATPFATS